MLEEDLLLDNVSVLRRTFFTQEGRFPTFYWGTAGLIILCKFFVTIFFFSMLRSSNSTQEKHVTIGQAIVGQGAAAHKKISAPPPPHFSVAASTPVL